MPANWPAKETKKMSTLEMPASQWPKTQSLFGGFARLVSLLRDVHAVFGEAQRQAYEAERRYPFTAW
jgi:hypothetical protein